MATNVEEISYEPERLRRWGTERLLNQEGKLQSLTYWSRSFQVFVENNVIALAKDQYAVDKFLLRILH